MKIQPQAAKPAILVGFRSKTKQRAGQIGLTPAGLKENGWAIAKDELAAKAAERSPIARKSARDRMTMVSGGGA